MGKIATVFSAMLSVHVLLCVATVLHQWIACLSWNQWDYKTTWSLQGLDSDDAKVLNTTWRASWDTAEQRYPGNIYLPPRPRRGHSLHIVKTDERSDYNGDTYLILFGGRDNDQRQEHIPKTYDVATLVSMLASGQNDSGMKLYTTFVTFTIILLYYGSVICRRMEVLSLRRTTTNR